jgi:hypothetical protein
MKTFLMLLTVLLLSSNAHAAQLLLGWDFPRDYPDQPASFRLSYTSSAAPEARIDAMAVPPSAVGACDAVPSATEDTYCAHWPECPAPGTVILFWVQAAWGDVVSTHSNIVSCQFVAGRPCVCVDPSLDPPPGVSSPGPAPLPPETTPQYWTDALAAILSTTPALAT